MLAPRIYLPAVAPFLLMAAASLACYVAAGASTGLFLGSLALITMVIPPIVGGERRLGAQAAAASGAILGTALIWIIAASNPALSASQIARCLVVLGGYVFALWGITRMLIRVRISATAASATVVLIGFAWLTWPIWLSHWLPGHEVWLSWLTPAHPPLAIDGVLDTMRPVWTERRLMYNQFTVLNQDIAYDLPHTIGWTVLLHACVGAITLLLGHFKKLSFDPKSKMGDQPA